MTTAIRWLGRLGMTATLVGIVGCDSGPGAGGSSASTAAAVTGTGGPASAPSVTSADPAPPPPADLDLAALQKVLACGANAKSGPCAVLAGFAACKVWSAEAPAGDGRWLGRGFEVDGKKTTEQVTVLRARRVPANEVGPGQLPARIGLGSIEKDLGAPFSEADRAIKALERSDVPPKGNAAVSHLKGMTQWSEAFVTRTVGGQVYGLAHAGLFVCEGARRELHMVRRASTRSGTGDGLYATLWAATW